MGRNTKQKTAIQNVFNTHGRPLTPQEVLLEASKETSMGIATVYRTITWLLNEQEIAVVRFPGEPTRYEKAGKKHHHHFQCRECRKVYEVEGCVNGLQALTPTGFKLEQHEILLHGLCAQCK